MAIIFQMFMAGSEKHTYFETKLVTGCLTSTKVVDFLVPVESIYMHCNFLLVINSNPGPILHHFRDIAGFLRKQLPGTPILGMLLLQLVTLGF